MNGINAFNGRYWNATAVRQLDRKMVIDDEDV